MVFISLPVKDLSKSVLFYEALGLTKKEDFPDAAGSWMIFSEAFSIMLITHAKWKEFTPRLIPDAKKTAQFGLSVTKETKNAVDQFVEKGTKAGGTADPNPVEDFGFMYGRSIEDPDGHIIEAKWIEMPA